MSADLYRGRLAPSPTGLLHLGHARTFWAAWRRAQLEKGALLYRNDDLDGQRCRREFVDAALADLRWLGLSWTEGPDRPGPHAPYAQSERRPLYRQALETLHAAGLIFPCDRSRRDVAAASGAPHEENGETEEPLYPTSFRPAANAVLPSLEKKISSNWRFRIPDGEMLNFCDGSLGPQRAVAGRDFGDFLVWRKDDMPSYQLACVVDDASMAITEVVRGADLITSTFRQILLHRALGQVAPKFFHCPLLRDADGVRLAKRNDALSLQALRHRGASPQALVEQFAKELSL